MSLDLRGNVLGDDGATAIADVLAEVPSLESVNLSNNGIEEEGGVALAESIEKADFSTRATTCTPLTITLENNPGLSGTVRHRLDDANSKVVSVKLSPLNISVTGFGR